MIKASIYQKDITIINIYVHNKRPARYMKQRLTELKRERDNSTVIVGDFSTPVSSAETTRTTRKKINKEIV